MQTRGDKIRSWVLGIWSGLGLLYLFIPIFIVVLFSFNDNKGRFNFTWQGFTLSHWADPFANPDLATALKNSVLIAIIATLIATALGTFMALSLVRYRFRGRGSVDFFVFLPLATPEVVLGAALLALFLQAGTNTGFATIVIAHAMFTISYVVVTVKARLEGMDRHIEEAAMDLGATEWATRRRCWPRRSRSTTTSSRASTPARRRRSRCSSSAPRARACPRRSTCSPPRCW